MPKTRSKANKKINSDGEDIATADIRDSTTRHTREELIVVVPPVSQRMRARRMIRISESEESDVIVVEGGEKKDEDESHIDTSEDEEYNSGHSSPSSTSYTASFQSTIRSLSSEEHEQSPTRPKRRAAKRKINYNEEAAYKVLENIVPEAAKINGVENAGGDSEEEAYVEVSSDTQNNINPSLKRRKSHRDTIHVLSSSDSECHKNTSSASDNTTIGLSRIRRKGRTRVKSSSDDELKPMDVDENNSEEKGKKKNKLLRSKRRLRNSKENDSEADRNKETEDHDESSDDDFVPTKSRKLT
ncbi:6954_t:CDS:2, partial [Paraglomus occultum]